MATLYARDGVGSLKRQRWHCWGERLKQKRVCLTYAVLCYLLHDCGEYVYIGMSRFGVAVFMFSIMLEICNYHTIRHTIFKNYFLFRISRIALLYFEELHICKLYFSSLLSTPVFGMHLISLILCDNLNIRVFFKEIFSNEKRGSATLFVN